jgi:hypothetical protein
LLLAFVPFIAFSVANHFVAPIPALMIAALVSLVIIGRDLVSGHSAKILEIGSCLLFGSLTVYAFISNREWSVIGVKLAIDVGLMLIVLFSLIVGRPFTIQYARESVPREL